MGMFISGKVAITATGVTDEKDITKDEQGRVAIDVIYIRPKMDYGTRQRVVGAAAKLTQSPAPQGNRRQRRAQRAQKKQEQNVDFDVGAYQIALLVQNVLGWDGPSFAGVACTPANIERLDSDNPLVQMVLKEIAERNNQGDDDDGGDEPAELDAPNVIEATAVAA